MSSRQIFEQSISISARVSVVEHCITDYDLMHQWLNPVLRCEAVDGWDTTLGSQSRFIIKIPFWQPTLNSRIIERDTGLIVWGFQGFFTGTDRWECQQEGEETRLINRFEFEVPNPLIEFGFNYFAAAWTKADMQAQLQRLKQIAEAVQKSKLTTLE